MTFIIQSSATNKNLFQELINEAICIIREGVKLEKNKSVF